MKNKSWKEVELSVINSHDEKAGLVAEQVQFVEESFRFCMLLFKKKNLHGRLNVSE